MLVSGWTWPAGCRAAAVLLLVSTRWWVELGPRISGWRALGNPRYNTYALECGSGSVLSVGMTLSRSSCGLRGVFGFVLFCFVLFLVRFKYLFHKEYMNKLFC